MSSQQPTIQELRALVAFADSGGVSAAASALGDCQPIISRRLKRFQQGDQILEKHGRALRLTRKGHHVLPEIRHLLGRYDRLSEYLAGCCKAPSLLRIGTGSFAAENYLPTALRAIRDRFPSWELRMSIQRGHERIIRTADGTLDFSIVSHDPSQVRTIVSSAFGEGTLLQAICLGTLTLCLAASPNSPSGRQLQNLGNRQPVALEDLLQWELLGLDANSGVRRQIERRIARGSTRLSFAVEGGGWHAAKVCACKGLGVAILPTVMIGPEDSQHLVIRRLPRTICIRHYLIYKEDLLDTDREELRQLLKQAVSRELRKANRRQTYLEPNASTDRDG